MYSSACRLKSQRQKVPIRSTKGLKTKPKTKTPPLTGIIYINASRNTEMYFSNAGVGSAERVHGNH